MDRKKFHFFNVVGCIAWVFSMMFSGYFLQKWIYKQFGFDLKDHLELIVLGIVLVTTAPVIIKMFTGRKKDKGPYSQFLTMEKKAIRHILSRGYCCCSWLFC